MDEWQLCAINLRNITRFLSLSLYLTILAGILILWPKTLPQTIPRWHCSCTGFPIPKPGYLHHCVKSGALQGSRRPSAGQTLGQAPGGSAKDTLSSETPHRLALENTGGLHHPKADPQREGHSKLFMGLVGAGEASGILAKVHRSAGPCQTLRTSCYAWEEPPFLSDSMSLGSSQVPQRTVRI